MSEAGSNKATEAFERLREGNRRFVESDRCMDTYLSHTRVDEHVQGQSPFAIVLGCSDSRVPVEIVFDAGLGELFVVRVAGNIAVPSVVGSIEFAAETFGTRLVVVLGHSGCGAVAATVAACEGAGGEVSENVGFIVERISPAVSKVLGEQADADQDTKVATAVRANVSATVDALRNDSAPIERLIREDGLMVVGAEYSLATGKVDFFE